MKQRKITTVLMALVLSMSLLAGCGSNKGDTSISSEAIQSETVTSEQTATDDENADAARNLLNDLNGSYQELWPVLFADEYAEVWTKDAAAFVGDENAQGAVDMLRSMVTAEIYGEEAVSRYAEYPDETAYDCGFTSELVTLTVDGMTISGKDSAGNELFSNTYHYIGMEDVRGLYEYESDDTNSGEFTYFYFAPDTSQETYHIEFRYGSDKEELDVYDAGRYAYWLPSGISTDYDQKMVEDCIQLFCAENLGG